MTRTARIGAPRLATGVRETCTRCGYPCETARFDIPGTYGPTLPAIARMRSTDAVVCDYCVADEIRAALSRGERAHVYLSSDGRYLTTWGGSVVARVDATHVADAGFCRDQTWHYGRTIGPDSVEVSGRGPGRGMYASTRARSRA